MTAVLVVGFVCLLFTLKWRLAPSPAGAGPLGFLYPAIFLPMAVICASSWVLLRWTSWKGLPLAVTVLLMVFSVVLNWVDLHFSATYLAFTIAVFGVGVIYSTNPVGYAALLVGSLTFLLVLVTATLPGRMQESDFWVLGAIVGMAFAGCLLLERQRRQAETLAVQLEEANAQLKESSFRDPLTGLYNRRYLIEFLAAKRALSIRMEIPLSLVLLDLDNFKTINDNLGHLVGDSVLQGVSLALQAGVRESDLAARYGGEEFVLVLPQAETDHAAQVTGRILETVSQTPYTGVPWAVTFSAGVARLRDEEPIESLLERADRLLYQAKMHKNRVVCE